jgi:hypothetical protein
MVRDLCRRCLSALHLTSLFLAVWYPQQDEPSDRFAYTIGVYYLFNEPEILVIHEENQLSQLQIAHTINFIRGASILGPKVVEGTRIGDIIQHLPEDKREQYRAYVNCKFHLVSEPIRREYFGFGLWFHCNFMDTLQFPALYCILESNPKESPVPATIRNGASGASKTSFLHIFVISVILVIIFTVFKSFLSS